jgi:hypothetical protein
MKNDVINPYFDEDKYKGQDIVNYGIKIPLKVGSPEDVFKKFSRRAQRIIKEKTHIFRELREEDLPILRRMWFDPQDDTFPNDLKEHFGLVLLHNGSVIGGAIWAKSGQGLFLHQLVAGEEGKMLNAPTILVWCSVQIYFNDYDYLDIGVSYNPKRYEFFSNFAVQKYPIILKKPFQVPVIRLSPFRSFVPRKTGVINKLNGNATFVPRASYGIYALLKYLNLQKDDVVLIIKTFENDVISKCITKQIEKVCKWAIVKWGGLIPKETKAILLVHEFGITAKLPDQLRSLGFPIIEDCAWSIHPKIIGSDYIIYSPQKMFNVNYGGLIVGIKLSDEFLWSIGCLDVFKRNLFEREMFRNNGEPHIAETRKKLWLKYFQLVKDSGLKVNRENYFVDMVNHYKWTPTVFFHEFKDEKEADEIRDRLIEFGIQAGRYWGEPIVYVPINQSMNGEELEYMIAVINGYFNLCKDYKK